jgi:metal-sulfur cluster biosynthetic enzyme
MPVSEEKVREELKKVIDPELFVNIVDLGLIYTIDIKEKETTSGDASAESKSDVSIEMTMTSPACPAGPQLISGSKNVVSQMEEVDEVEVKLVMDPPWTPDRMTEDARDQLGIF